MTRKIDWLDDYLEILMYHSGDESVYDPKPSISDPWTILDKH